MINTAHIVSACMFLLLRMYTLACQVLSTNMFVATGESIPYLSKCVCHHVLTCVECVCYTIHIGIYLLLISNRYVLEN